jgi:hypothetical protein
VKNKKKIASFRFITIGSPESDKFAQILMNFREDDARTTCRCPLMNFLKKKQDLGPIG